MVYCLWGDQMTNETPSRKHLRLSSHDYSSRGAYFVTICVKNRMPLLSSIKTVKEPNAVGDGAHDVPCVELTPMGNIVEKHLLSSKNIKGVQVDKYIIMPDHIHVIFFINMEPFNCAQGTSRAPSPTNEMLPHIISTFKRFCSKEIGYNIFQRSYIDHIIRDRDDYLTKVKYLSTNPARKLLKDKK